MSDRLAPGRILKVSTTLAGSLAALASLQGCFTSQPPTLEVAGVRAGEPKDGRSVVLIDVIARNPNRDPLPLKGMHYVLTLNNEPAFEGVRDAQATIRGYGVQRLTLPAPVSAGRIAPGETKFSVKGEVTYIAPEVLAQTLFDNDIRDWTTSVKGDGVVAK